jgi:hypothetical protein
MPWIEGFETGLKIGEEQDPTSILHSEGTALIELSKKDYEEAKIIYDELEQKIKTLSEENLGYCEARYQEFINKINLAYDLEHPEAGALITLAELNLLLSFKHFKFHLSSTTEDEKIQIVESAKELAEMLEVESLASNYILLSRAASKIIDILKSHKSDDHAANVESLESTLELCEKLALSAITLLSTADADIDSPTEVEQAEKKKAEYHFKNLLPIYFSQYQLAKIRGEGEKIILEKINIILKNKELRKKVDPDIFLDACEKFTECMTATESSKKEIKREDATGPTL